jgi:hypothetical protein
LKKKIMIEEERNGCIESIVYGLTKTLPPATAVQLLPADSTRQLLLRATTSANPASWKFGNAPISASDGLVLDTTTLAGGRQLLTGASVPIDSVWPFSQLGTTVCVEVGKPSLRPGFNL